MNIAASAIMFDISYVIKIESYDDNKQALGYG